MKNILNCSHSYLESTVKYVFMMKRILTSDVNVILFIYIDNTIHSGSIPLKYEIHENVHYVQTYCLF